jgi:hypothetical protein
MMRVVVRNALAGATISCALATVLLLFASQQLRHALTISPLAIHWAALEQLAADFLYMWCAATLGTLIYGALAQRLGIYGQGSHALRKWKNGLLGLLIIVPIVAFLPAANRFAGVSPEITAPLYIAIALAIVLSDVHGPPGALAAGD